MSTAKPNDSEGPIRSPEVTTAAAMNFNLDALGKSLSTESQQAGHTADTIVKYPDLRIVLITMKAGAHMKEHRTAGSISVQTLAGHISVRTAEGTVDLPSGHLATFAAEIPHSVDALADSLFLLTIAWREKTSPVT